MVSPAGEGRRIGYLKVPGIAQIRADPAVSDAFRGARRIPRNLCGLGASRGLPQARRDGERSVMSIDVTSPPIKAGSGLIFQSFVPADMLP
jgi:hypothetical protein